VLRNKPGKKPKMVFETLYIPIGSGESFIRKLLFRKKFFKEIVDAAYKEMMK